MFRNHLHLSVLATMALLVSAASAEEIDLAKVERTILREPAWQSKSPKYCLIVVSAEKRVWFVSDGDDLYMDINGNGDLTEPDEKLSRLNLSPEERRETKNDSLWRIPEIAGTDGLPAVKNISLYRDANKVATPGAMVVSFEVADRPRASVRTTFAASAKDAPIIHPTAPTRLNIQINRILSSETGDDGVKVLRPGFSVIGQCYVQWLFPGTNYLTATPDLDCKMEFPLADGKTEVLEMSLIHYTDWGTYRSNSTTIPFDVVDGNVRITVSVTEPAAGKFVPKPVVIEKKVADLGGAPQRAKRWLAASAKSAEPERPVPVREALLTFQGERAIAFSPDGKRLAVTFSVENPNPKPQKYATVVKLLDATTGEETLRLPPFTGSIDQRVVFSSDGKRLAASNKIAATVWDATSGQELLKLEGLDRVLGLALSPGGKMLAYRWWSNRNSAGRYEGTSKVVNVASGKEWLTFKHEAASTRLDSLDFSLHGTRLLAFSPDGTRLATVDKDATLTLWDTTKGEATLTMNRDNIYSIRSLAFSPDGRRLATVCGDATVTMWDATSGEATLTVNRDNHYTIHSLAFSPDGTRLAVARWDQTVSVWDAQSGEETLRLKGHFHLINQVAFSPDGKQLATAGGKWPFDIKPLQLPTEAFVRLWDASTGEETLRLKGLSSFGIFAFSPDGRRLVAQEGRFPSGDKIKVWDVAPYSADDIAPKKP